MAQESRFGRAVYLNVGASVSTKDGRNIAITSNEVARLGSLLQRARRMTPRVCGAFQSFCTV